MESSSATLALSRLVSKKVVSAKTAEEASTRRACCAGCGTNLRQHQKVTHKRSYAMAKPRRATRAKKKLLVTIILCCSDRAKKITFDDERKKTAGYHRKIFFFSLTITIRKEREGVGISVAFAVSVVGRQESSPRRLP